MIILRTERLLLRRLVPEDLPHLHELYSDPEIRRYFPEGTLSLEETKEELEWFLEGHPDDSRLGLWATILKEDGRFAGRCGLLPWTIEGRDEVEVAYMLGRPWWGQGLATETARGIVRHAFEDLGLSRLIALIDADNALDRGGAADRNVVREGSRRRQGAGDDVWDDTEWNAMKPGPRCRNRCVGFNGNATRSADQTNRCCDPTSVSFLRT